MSAAMILAAGRGQRMRPLTDVTPKPLLQVRGKALMQWPMQALARGGFHRLVVNTAWLGEQISDFFGTIPASNGHELLSNLMGVQVAYSHEGRDFGRALETAGGIVRALPLLDEVFWVLAGDVYAPDFAFTQAAVDRFAASGKLAHLWLVPLPATRKGWLPLWRRCCARRWTPARSAPSCTPDRGPMWARPSGWPNSTPPEPSPEPIS
jgi:MurNAc alpha-1-phosphate uridylyltransferase